MNECDRLAELSRAIRESTLKRLRIVPQGLENWRISQRAMSFADLAQHIIDADRWLFKKLEVKTLKPIVGEAGRVNISSRDEYLHLLKTLEVTGEARIDVIKRLNDKDLTKQIYDDRFNGDVTVWWIIVRGNFDHEIQHRGQISAYLRSIEDDNCGLASA
jgi:uncharacterized damage-inducible protein DinB